MKCNECPERAVVRSAIGQPLCINHLGARGFVLCTPIIYVKRRSGYFEARHAIWKEWRD